MFLKSIGSQRLIYESDAPYTLVPAKIIRKEKQGKRVFVATENPFYLAENIREEVKTMNFKGEKSVAISSLEALIDAIESLKIPKRESEGNI